MKPIAQKTAQEDNHETNSRQNQNTDPNCPSESYLKLFTKNLLTYCGFSFPSR